MKYHQKNRWTVPLVVLIVAMFLSFLFLLEKVQSPASNDIRSRAVAPVIITPVPSGAPRPNPTRGTLPPCTGILRLRGIPCFVP